MTKRTTTEQICIMKRSLKKIALAIVAAGLTASGGADAANRLWYKTAADDWMKAIPLGNGRIGAMVYGGDSKERIALNEISLWSGQYDPTSNDLCGREALDEMRQCFYEGDVEKGTLLAKNI